MDKKNNDIKKKLDYYLSLRYPVEIIPIPEEEGGGYMARMPQFGDAIIGDGDTPEEALADLEEFKKERFRDFLEAGESIPEPEREEYSGKFIIRVPKYLHRALAEEAKRNGVSLNQFVNSLLIQALTNHRYKMIIYFEDVFSKSEFKWKLPGHEAMSTDDYMDRKAA